MGTNVRTNEERTKVNPKVHRLRRETKNQTIPMNQSEEKWEKHHFLAFLRGLRGIRGHYEFSQKYENSQIVGIT